jgi:hypothetical protein
VWWQYAEPKRMVVRSNVFRKLPQSGTHLAKIMKALVVRKVNVLILPNDLGNSVVDRFVQNVADEFEKQSSYKKTVARTHPLQFYREWLLGQVVGGSHAMPLADRPWVFGRFADEVEVRAYARIQSWLEVNAEHWRSNLFVFRETKQEYMEKEWRQKKVRRKTYTPRKGHRDENDDWQPGRKGTSRQALARAKREGR